ncbi:MAG: hypothetical protein M3R00_00345, partial [Pseudomonadota bacterium]|nr:hypothetical protein [Pseudomonadota bacterium]
MRVERAATTGNLIAQTQNKYHDAISKICAPLFKNTPIDYFDYTRYYDSGRMVACGTHPDFTAQYYVEGLYPSLEEFQTFSSFGLKSAFLTHQMPIPSVAHKANAERYEQNVVAAADSKIFHRLYFIERHKDFYITSGFGVKSEIASIFHFYLNSLTILENFIKYFEHHAAELIEENAMDHSIIMPYYHHKSLGIGRGDNA